MNLHRFRFPKPTLALPPMLWILATAMATAMVSPAAFGQPADVAKVTPAPLAAHWLSADTPIYAELSSTNALLDRYQDRAVVQLWQALPNYEELSKNEDLQKVRLGLDLVAGSLGTTWERMIGDIGANGVVLGIEPGPGPRPVTIGLFITPRDAKTAASWHDQVIKMVREHADGNGQPDPVKTKIYRGVTAYSLNTEFAHAIVNGVIVVANGGDSLKTFIDRALDHNDAAKRKDTPFHALAENPAWKEQRAVHANNGALAWGIVRLDILRKLDPNKFVIPEDSNPNPLGTLLFGRWIAAVRTADWVAARIDWKRNQLGAQVTLGMPKSKNADVLARFVPSAKAGSNAKTGAAPLLQPPGVIASFSLWRDLSAVWEAKESLLSPEAVQGLAQLDTVSGQFFGGRDFGTGVLGGLTADWRIVVAEPTPIPGGPTPSILLPAFALVVGLNPDDDSLGKRLPIAFQSFVAIINLEAGKSQAPPLVLGSETYAGATLVTAKYLADEDNQNRNKNKGKNPGDNDKNAEATAKPKAPQNVHIRHNFSPAAVRVNNHFVLSSSTKLGKDLIDVLNKPDSAPESKSKAGAAGPTLALVMQGDRLAAILKANQEQMVTQNMINEGNDRAAAEKAVGFLETLAKTLGQGALEVFDTPNGVRVGLTFRLNPQ